MPIPIDFFMQEGEVEFYVVDADSYRFLYANKMAQRNLGYTLDELKELTPAIASPRYTYDAFRKFLSPLRKTTGRRSITLGNTHTRKDGTVYPVDVHIQYFEHEGRGVYVGFIFDATARQRQLDQLRAVIKGARLGFWDFNEATGIYFTDDNWLGMLGLVRGDIDERDPEDWQRFIHPDDKGWLLDAVVDAMRKRQSYVLEFRMLHKDGHVVWVQSAASVVEWDQASDRPVRLSGTHRDITQQKEVEDKLRRQEEITRTLVENSQDLVVMYDRDHRYVYVNHALGRALETPVDEFIGKTRDDFPFPDELRSLWHDTVEDVFSSGESRSRYYEMDAPHGRLHMDWNVFPGIRDHNGEVTSVFGVSRDISASKKAEAELQKIERLNSIGILAGGIAHDFNNILTILFGYIDMAKSEIGDPKNAMECLEKVEKAFHRASSLTNQLLTFSKGGEPIRQDVNLEALVMETVTFDLSDSNVKLELGGNEDLWPAYVDSGQVAQVFSNLTINAAQAMPRGGVLAITLENAQVRGGDVTGLKPGRYIRAVIADEGVGIPASHLDKIFDPYFTTKQKGSGLGLATVYSIVSRHGGHIGARSTPGKGTIFTLYLPASAGTFAADQSPQDKKKKLPGEAGRVLVMDDEPMICELAAAILLDEGFAVDIANDGAEALTRYRDALAASNPYHCLVMDLTIPGGVGGEEAVKDILALDPAARVVVSSGYAVDPVMANYADYGFTGVITKPFTRQALLTEIRRQLR